MSLDRASRLHVLRQRHDVTIGELARRSGWSPEDLHRLEDTRLGIWSYQRRTRRGPVEEVVREPEPQEWDRLEQLVAGASDAPGGARG